MEGYEPDGFALLVIPLVFTSLMASAAAVAWSLHRQRTLLMEGRFAQAKVVGSKKIRSDKRRAFRVTYEFQTLSGAKQIGKLEVGKTPPPVGSALPIVYHRDNPKWSAAYPLKLVRADGVRLVSDTSLTRGRHLQN